MSKIKWVKNGVFLKVDGLVDVSHEVRVIARDPEYADMSNPRGEITGKVYFLKISLDDGEIWRHEEVWHEEDKKKAMDMADLLNTLEGEYNMTDWFYYGDVYGSKAYEAVGRELELI